MKECKTCVVNATCTKKEHEGTLCQDVFETITKKIESLREEAARLESLYGLEAYYYHKNMEGKDPEKIGLRSSDDHLDDLPERFFNEI